MVGCSTVYVRLLDEGTDVFRPVSAQLVRDSTYLLGGENIFDPEDEHWEFPPGTTVNVEARRKGTRRRSKNPDLSQI
jgi:hypothetical protein